MSLRTYPSQTIGVHSLRGPKICHMIMTHEPTIRMSFKNAHLLLPSLNPTIQYTHGKESPSRTYITNSATSGFNDYHYSEAKWPLNQDNLPPIQKISQLSH